MATNTGILDLVKPAGNENALISVINSNMDKVDAEAGRQRGNIAANYSTSSAYDVGDLCIYQGNLYRCNTAIASGEEWTAAHWTQVNIAGELDSQKQDIASNTQDIASNTQAIANLNEKITDTGWTTINQTYPTYMRVKNGYVTINMRLSGGTTPTDGVQLYTLPSAYRPTYEMAVPTQNLRGNLYIKNDTGVITINQNSGQTLNNFMAATITYPINDNS